ncbi:aminoglycoside phosphotransferase family protein [Streptomyces sp. NPDC052042]|uniref:aminoglycoside phosphotransferase family protein n=1 Tax=Streptomyces sp. NPDC052042 TaxID=3365683 RepID=UPI0037CE00C2
MTEKPFPPELRAWAAEYLSGLDTIEDRSWPRSSSRVWRVAAGPRSAFVKLSPSRLDYDREAAGYAYTGRLLAEHEAPRLLAADAHLRALLSSPLPGQVVRDLPLDLDVELRLHENAGRLLRLWHDASDSGSAADRAAVRAAMQEQAQEAADCLEDTAVHLAADRIALVEAASKDLVELAEQVPLVFRHGDYATRNWLYDAKTGRHGLIDFAMAQYGVAAEEFVWLGGAVWPTRPDLKDAYFTGYGRPLTQEEEQLLRLLIVRLGVSYLRNGLVKDRGDLVARGHLILDRMASHRP